MRRPNRQLSIFSLSALDVLATATGVFVLLLVMLMPYYQREHQAHAEIDDIRAAENDRSAEIEQLETKAVAAEAAAAAIETQIAELSAAAEAMEQKSRSAARELEEATAAANPDQGGNVETPVIERLDLVFVVDTTASMGPVIREIARSLGSVVRILEQLVPSLQVAVVAYKDRDSGVAPIQTMPFVDPGRDLTRVVGYIEQLSATVVGSRTIAEDVHLGLRSALSLPFRTEALKSIIVIGDAATHRGFVDEAFSMASRFASTGERQSVSALFVTTPTSLRFGNRDRAFFQALANAGRGEFNDHTSSMIESILLSVLVRPDVASLRP